MSSTLRSYMAPVTARLFRRSETTHAAAPEEHATGVVDDFDLAGDEGENQGHGETHESEIMTFFFVALLIGCFVRFNLELVRKTFRVRIPYSVVLLVVGGGLGYATWDKVEAGAGLSDEAFT
eukprot:1620926-Rhodomonas_salina.2